jgi:hypothetical protein
MKVITRRELIELYIRYDARKKNGVVPPDLSEWDWSSADAIDMGLAANGFKSGIIAGYTSWCAVELDRAELSRCAIVSSIFPTLPRVLGQLQNYAEFDRWRPNHDVEWFEPLENDAEYPREWPLILRPSVAIERPAIWYLEDGSGRGICFFRRLVRSGDDAKCAFGYVGVTPDRGSTFMRQTFESLLHLDA